MNGCEMIEIGLNYQWKEEDVGIEDLLDQYQTCLVALLTFEHYACCCC